jgi:hypothetical protein
MESFALAWEDAFGPLPQPGDQGTYALRPRYMDQAAKDLALQLRRAGIRLAFMLNQILSAVP